MNIIETRALTEEQKAHVMRLWNEEYPSQLKYDSIEGFNSYLNNLQVPCHILAIDSGELVGWAFSFLRDSERWFAIILTAATQGKGLGSTLLNKLKENEMTLNGWVTDHDRYVKQNGEKYVSPLRFYLKNDFTVCAGARLETETLSAVKIKWTKVA